MPITVPPEIFTVPDAFIDFASIMDSVLFESATMVCAEACEAKNAPPVMSAAAMRLLRIIMGFFLGVVRGWGTTESSHRGNTARQPMDAPEENLSGLHRIRSSAGYRDERRKRCALVRRLERGLQAIKRLPSGLPRVPPCLHNGLELRS